MVQPPFISVADLAERRQASQAPSVIDARAERAFLRGHIPGAVNLDARFLNASQDGARQLADAGELAHKLLEIGLAPGPVVVYGARGGSDSAHAWWTLAAMGLDDVWILDGGIEAWITAGLSVSEDPGAPSPAKSALELTPVPDLWIDMAEIRGRLDDDNLLILDTRAPEEFSGEDQLADRGGHIPGARLMPWDRLLTGDPLVLRPSPELRELLSEALAAPEVATYCQSGVRAAHTLAILKMLGHRRPRLYLGSWEEWGNDKEAPINGSEAR